MKQNELSGKTAVVTGASSGLGPEFARQLAAAGCNLVLVARRRERLEALADLLRHDHGTNVRIYSVDLVRPGAATGLSAALQGEGVGVDILINNAGFGTHGSFIETDGATERNMLTLNVVALTELTKLFARAMVERGYGRILQVSSLAAYQPTPTYAVYASSKTYVLHFGEAVNYELRGTGVTCTVVSPGATRTEFFETAGQTPTWYQRAVIMQPEPVCRAALRAMVRGRPSVVPGVHNKLSALLMRLIPRRWATALASLSMTPR